MGVPIEHPHPGNSIPIIDAYGARERPPLPIGDETLYAGGLVVVPADQHATTGAKVHAGLVDVCGAACRITRKQGEEMQARLWAPAKGPGRGSRADGSHDDPLAIDGHGQTAGTTQCVEIHDVPSIGHRVACEAWIDTMLAG